MELDPNHWQVQVGIRCRTKISLRVTHWQRVYCVGVYQPWLWIPYVRRERHSLDAAANARILVHWVGVKSSMLSVSTDRGMAAR